MTEGNMASVLLAGYVPEFLEVRDKVLRAAKYEVTVSPTWASATAAIGQKIFDVAVLDFSIPEDERNRLARAIKQASPATRIIMIYFASIKNAELADALLQTSASAEDMVRAVHHLLNERDHNGERAG